MRDEMVTSISQITNLTITTDVLLFGTDEVSDEVNTTIFEAVQKFIKNFKGVCKLIIQHLVSWILTQHKTNQCISTLLMCKNSSLLFMSATSSSASLKFSMNDPAAK